MEASCLVAYEGRMGNKWWLREIWASSGGAEQSGQTHMGARVHEAFEHSIEHVQGEMDEGGSLLNMHATQQLTNDRIEHSDAPSVMNVMVCASPWALMCSSPSPTSAWLAQ
jgi:hypothetical protein